MSSRWTTWKASANGTNGRGKDDYDYDYDYDYDCDYDDGHGHEHDAWRYGGSRQDAGGTNQVIGE